MRYWNNNPELLDEITIERLPEPYKTWCEKGEKPFPWWKFSYRWPIYHGARLIEKLFPRFQSRAIKVEGKPYNRWYRGLAWPWYPFGEEYYTSDVPDNIRFPAMEEGMQDHWGDMVDHAVDRYETLQMEGLI